MRHFTYLSLVLLHFGHCTSFLHIMVIALDDIVELVNIRKIVIGINGS